MFLSEFHDHIKILSKLASKSSVSHKHAACLINGNKKLITIGLNKHIKIKNENVLISIHAEQDCLANCNPKFYKGLDILVIRVGPSNKLLNSRPCNSCITKLQEKGIRKVYYSNSDGNIVCELVDSMKKIHICAGKKFRNKN